MPRTRHDDRARRAFRLHRCARSAVVGRVRACDDSRIWPIRFSARNDRAIAARATDFIRRGVTPRTARDVVFEGDVDVDVDVDALDALDARRVQASRDAVAAQSRDADRATPASVAASASSEPVVVELKVEGMMCDGCAESVTTKLMNNDKGVKVTAVDVDLATKIVRVSIDCESVVDGVTKLPALVETVVEGGFEAEPIF